MNTNITYKNIVLVKLLNFKSKLSQEKTCCQRSNPLSLRLNCPSIGTNDLRASYFLWFQQ